MNNTRRKTIRNIRLSLEDIMVTLESTRDDEQDAFDNLPESLQESERGERMQECIDYLDEAIGSLEEAMDNLTDENFE